MGIYYCKNFINLEDYFRTDQIKCDNKQFIVIGFEKSINFFGDFWHVRIEK
jgi:hypothetical protein